MVIVELWLLVNYISRNARVFVYVLSASVGSINVGVIAYAAKWSFAEISVEKCFNI